MARTQGVDLQEARAAAAANPTDVDAAIMVAAVADWKVRSSPFKLKKAGGPPQIELLPNPDILATVAKHPLRPRLLVGFAAETDDLLANAAAKRDRKGADWIVANDVSGDVMGGSHNHVHLVTAGGKRAVTHYRLLKAVALRASRLELRLETGRTHQIRVHLASSGFPIVCDDKYGDFALNREMQRAEGQRSAFKRMFLHAHQLTFVHPDSGKPVTLKAGLPPECQRLLKALEQPAGK